MSLNRRQRAYVRRAVMDYARRYLGVTRLPSGVPAMLREWVATLDRPPMPEEVGALVRPYRKPYFGL